MSDIMEKTLASLPELIASSLGAKKEGSNTRGFQNFVQNFCELRTKHEEEQFIKKELTLQKQKLMQPNMTPSQIRESLIRLVYCHMLGYDVTFGFIHAVKLAQQGSILQKQVGYLVCSLFLHDSHELVMLLINTIQKDLKSTNILEVCCALTAASKLISSEMIPALLPMVEEKMRHPKEIIRKKTVMCLHSFHLKAPSMLQHVHHLFHRALCDKDPGVMWAASHVYADLIQKNPASYQKMVPGFIKILQQVIDRRLHTEYDYHTVPAPWLTIHLLRLLRMLGTGNQQSSQQMYQVLKEVLQRTEPSHKMGLAVIFECLETIASVYPQPALLEHAANCVGRFLSAKSINLKYLGLKALTCVIEVNAQYALPHQDVVIECLEHRDSTIRRKTLLLLYKIANPSNVQVICGKMLEQLTTDSDHHSKLDIVDKVINLTERFWSNGQWYISTMNQVLLIADSLAPPSASHNIIMFLSREAEKVDSDKSLLEYAATVYWQLLQRDKLPEALLQVAVWVIGSKFHDLPVEGLPLAASTLASWYHKSQCQKTQTMILTALTKLSPELDADIEPLTEVIQTASKSSDKDLSQRALELQRLLRCSADLKKVVSAMSLQKEELDLSLSFLDEYVADSLERGQRPYRPYGLRHPQPQRVKEPSTPMSGLNFLPYESPLVSSAVTNSSPSLPFSQERAAPSSALSAGSGDSGGKDKVSLHMKGVKRVWGKEGLVEKDTSVTLPSLPTNQPTQASSDRLPQVRSPRRMVPVAGQQQQQQQQPPEEVKRKQQLASQLFSGLNTSTSSSPISSDFINNTSTPEIFSSTDSAFQQPQPEMNNSMYSQQVPTTTTTTTSTTTTLQQNQPPKDGFDWRQHRRTQNCENSPEQAANNNNSSESQLSTAGNHLSHNVNMPQGTTMGTSLLDSFDDEEEEEKEEGEEDGDLRTREGQSMYSGMRGDHNELMGDGEEEGEQQDEGCMNGAQQQQQQQQLQDHQLHQKDSQSNPTPEQANDSRNTSLSQNIASIVPQEFHDVPHETTPTVIIQNKALLIKCQKVWKPENLVVCVCVEKNQENDSGVDNNSTLRLDVKGQLRIELQKDGDVLTDGTVDLNKFDSTDHFLVICKPDVSDEVVVDSIRLELSPQQFDLENGEMRINISALDFVRPCLVSVEEYSSLWTTCQHDEKLQLDSDKLQSGKLSLPDKIAALLHLHLVQSLGQEHILAGQWVDNSEDVILVHCQQTETDHPSTTVKLWLKTSHQSTLRRLLAALVDR